MPFAQPFAEVFEVAPGNAKERLAQKGYSLPGIQLKGARSRRGEMLVFYEGHPVPRKGLPYPEASEANNTVKRITMGLFAPLAAIRKGPIAFLEEFLANYCRLADSIYFKCNAVPYLKREWYISTGKGIWDLTEVFLTELGISNNHFQDKHKAWKNRQGVASYTGKVLATILEYDDFYRIVVVDIMSEFTKEEILRSPGKFVKKAINLFLERSDNKELKAKFQKFATLLSLLLWIPRVRRAFRKAFEAVDMSLLQYDEYDYYWQLPRDGYDIQGRPFKDRSLEFQYRQAKYLEELNAVQLRSQHAGPSN